MESYELDPDKIIAWAVNYANYDDLEKVAKAVYGVYVQQRKHDHPKEHKKNKQLRRKLK